MTRLPTLLPPTIAERFARFHDENPGVYRALLLLARQARTAGMRKVGIAMLYEVARWRFALATKGDVYRLNNSYRSRYVRKLTAEHPELAYLFETRKLKSK